MFIKIVRYESEVSEQVIECREFTQCYTPDTQGKEAYFMIYGKLEPQTINIECATTAVYIMSDTGKTIDSYKWREFDGVVKRM
jgi:hypothetical protein